MIKVTHRVNVKEEKTEEVVVDTKLTVKELKAICKEKGLTGYSKLKEDALIALIKEADEPEKIEEVVIEDEGSETEEVKTEEAE